MCECVRACACICEYNLSFHDGAKQCNNHSQKRMNCLCVSQKLDMWKIGAHFIESHLCMLQINHVDRDLWSINHLSQGHSLRGEGCLWP